MKATKKIVGAACALVAAVALSAGSTFAWFSQSGKVTATGMFVKAKTTEALVIANENDKELDKWGITAKSTDTKTTTLTPTSTVDAKKFYNVNEEYLTKVDYQSGYASEEAIFEESENATAETGDKYYVTHTYYIKAEASKDSEKSVKYGKLYVSNITVKTKAKEATEDTEAVPAGESSAAISKSLRVSVQWGENGTAYIYAPLGGENRDGKGVKGTGAYTSDILGAVAIQDKYDADDAVDLTGDEFVTTTAEKVIIKIWYEGQDPECTSFNAMSVEELEVSVDFAAGESEEVDA